ncbi:MAG: 1-acyl-sn-glycerol-3-phosphate acyltransferase [Leptospiraceae bacterium]|nr:1-acyl-sn-glycerol-3-phosphate acyltransferase [Leptospiraceae bacterium]
MFYILGRFLGWVFFYTIIIPMRIQYGNRKCKFIYDEKQFNELNRNSLIIVSNHIKPRNKFLRLISMPYDAFILRAFLLRFGIYTTALTSYDAGKIRKGEKLSKSKYNKEQLIKGIVLSMDLIPLNRNERDDVTNEDIANRINLGNLGIGIFPEGTWFRGFRKNRKIFSGAAVLAKKYKMNILPIYLDAYNLKQDSEIRVGEMISMDLPSAEISASIRNQLNELYILNQKAKGINNA